MAYYANTNETKKYGPSNACSLPCIGDTVLSPNGKANCGGPGAEGPQSLFFFADDRSAACPSAPPMLECPLIPLQPPSPPSPPSPPNPPPSPPAPPLIQAIGDFGEDEEDEEQDASCEEDMGCMFNWGVLKQTPSTSIFPKIGVPGTTVGEQGCGRCWGRSGNSSG